MSELKQVKVENWGIFFLQRLKHFFNRTDYCDLTLQFQDNAQLKVHRLVLNACTEYFQILERTCEMYEDCLIMPDDLQTDVMVPIINFMYTGHLEYKDEMFEKLYQTSQIMNMTVLTKLLGAQRSQPQKPSAPVKPPPVPTKRSYTKAFESKSQSSQKYYTPPKKLPAVQSTSRVVDKSPLILGPSRIQCIPAPDIKKPSSLKERRPTRYDLPEELDTDNLFESSFTNISYDSKPLMVHPDTKHYSAKKPNYGIFSEASSSKKYDDIHRILKEPSTSTEFVECKRITMNSESMYEDESEGYLPENFDTSTSTIQKHSYKDSNELFDQILDNGPKVTIESKDLTSNAANLDHAKIISAVLKKYPHFVKGNKNIKLKILNKPSKAPVSKPVIKKRFNTEKPIIPKQEPDEDYTYESEVMDSKKAARLIALGAENIKGPWICLICGTPGRALHFTTYFKFRRHLIEVHNEKPIINSCEYCGLKSGKRNYLLHHMYTKHGIPPPPAYKFPKCNQCNYIALTEGFLVKHKMSHLESRDFRCNVCTRMFKSSHQLRNHIQITGHKICADRKQNYQCLYCLKFFLRESNLYAHLKTCHKEEVRNDGIIDNSDEEEVPVQTPVKYEAPVKYEPVCYDSDDSNDVQYQIQQRSDGDIQVLSKKSLKSPKKQKILNQGYSDSNSNNVMLPHTLHTNLNNEFEQHEEIEMDQSSSLEKERGNVVQQIFFSKNKKKERYILPSMSDEDSPPPHLQIVDQSPGSEFIEAVPNEEANMIMKKTGKINQPIQIVVSNEEEYKALMASNPSIIFDENNPGKTLTVLTTPHHSSLSATTTIDLNNPQSNEMMILPDDYPLVSDTVTSDNSNIVVVYSHPVEQNKQYLVNTHYDQQQLIATQGIGAQFVETSAVITQNYETITTPLVSGQVTVQEAWTENVHHAVSQANEGQQYAMPVDQETVLLPPVTEVDSPATIEPISSTDLPEVQIGTQRINNKLVMEITPHQVTTNVEMQVDPQHSDIAGLHDNQEVIENTEVVMLNNCQTSGEVFISNDQNNEPISSTIVIDNTADELTHDTTPNIDTTLQVSEALTEDELTSEVDKPQESDDTNMMPQENDAVNVSITNGHDTAPTSVLKEKIQTLAMEWSEDEEEMPVQCQENDSTPTETSQTDGDNIETVTEETSEVEESIENIQQEVEKQVQVTASGTDITVAEDYAIEENLATSVETVESEELNDTLKPEVSVKAKEKISSLLNDWDENDSQNGEEITSQNESEPVTGDPQEPLEEAEVVSDMASIKKIHPKENNINKLVSDWEEEEETENKE